MKLTWKWTLEYKAEKSFLLSYFHTFSQEIMYVCRKLTFAVYDMPTLFPAQ